MKTQFISFPVFFILFAYSSQAAAQITDSSNSLNYFFNLQQNFLDKIRDNAQIYHGSQYIRNGQKAIGSAFYRSDSMIAGTIYYQGTMYPNHEMLYDLVTDRVIINNYMQSGQMTLAPEKVDSFQIQFHHFVLLNAEKTNGLEKTGYYDNLFSGEPGLFKRIEKRRMSGSGNEETRYTEYNDYFIKLKDVYHTVNGEKALVKLFQDKEDMVIKYIRSNKLNFKKNLESSLLLTTTYYSYIKP